MSLHVTRKLPRDLSIKELLERKTFEQLLKDGDIYEPKDAAPLMGYAAMHIRYMCREKKIEHIERGGSYYLYARTVHGVARHVAPSAKKRS